MSPTLAKLREDVGKSCALLGAERDWFCAADEFEAAIVGLEAKLERLRDALRAIVALNADDANPGFAASPDYWAGVGEAAEIARRALE